MERMKWSMSTSWEVRKALFVYIMTWKLFFLFCSNQWNANDQAHLKGNEDWFLLTYWLKQNNPRGNFTQIGVYWQFHFVNFLVCIYSVISEHAWSWFINHWMFSHCADVVCYSNSVRSFYSMLLKIRHRENCGDSTMQPFPTSLLSK